MGINDLSGGPLAGPRAYLSALGVLLAAVALAFVANRLLPHANLSLLFLTGVLVVAARYGLGPSFVASIFSFLAYNFFFTLPYYTFEVDDDGDVATLVFFLIVAGITGNLAVRMRQEMERSRISLLRVSNLYEFGRRMSSAAGTDQVLDALADHVARTLKVPVLILLPDERGLPSVRSRSGPPGDLAEDAAIRAWRKILRDEPQIEDWRFFALTTDRGPVGMVAVQLTQDEEEQLELVRRLCDQAALALDRTLLVADLERARLESETEQLRSALLSSVSHDLRTPLAAIIGSTTSVLEYGHGISEADRRELLHTAVDEAQRLDRYIQNLLDMTRLGQGKLQLRRDWVDLNDIVSTAVERLRNVPEGVRIEIRVAPDVPLLWVHGVLLEQALYNLLDNAVRFSPDDGRIGIDVRSLSDTIRIEVCDEGPGIPEPEREKVFDMFYSVRDGDRGAYQGTGLGLAICRGLVAAHGGSVSAHEGVAGRGTCMRVELPLVTPDRPQIQ